MNRNKKNRIKRAGNSVLALAVATVAFACSNNENRDMKIAEETKEKVNKAVDVTRDAANETIDSVSQAWDDFSGYSIEKKDEAVDYLNRQMIALDLKIESLSEKSKSASESGKESAEEAIAELKEKRADLALQVEKTKNATAETWAEVKLETKKKWNSFTESLQELSNKLTR